jgi:hypothetical protein
MVGESVLALVHESFIALALLAATSSVAGFFAYIYTLKRQPYLLLWTAGWSLFALHYLSPALSEWIPDSPLESALNRWLFALAGLFFFLGAQLYAQRKPWITQSAILGGILGVGAIANGLNFLNTAAVVVPSALLFLGVAIIFWLESRRQETLADRLLAISFFVWAALRLTVFFVFFSPTSPLDSGLRPITAIPSAFVAMLMVMALYEEEKRRIERNMLALSNLNLATSSFVGGEIQRMLSQALDRVLGVVRLPAGALFLHHGDPQGPTSVVAAGLNDEFCGVAQEEGLDDYLVGPANSRWLKAFAASSSSACRRKSKLSACFCLAPQTIAASLRPSFACSWPSATRLAWRSRTVTSSSRLRAAPKSCTSSMKSAAPSAPR